MRFSPDGMHLLGGKASAGIFIDGRRIMEQAGNWGWTENDEVSGPGGYNGPYPGLYRWVASNPGQVGWFSEQLATEFYGNGEGKWILYYAERSGPYSIDSDGHRWTDRVALDFLGDYQILTDFSYVPLILRNAITGAEQRIEHPGEWTPLPDNSTYFSRNYRGCYRGIDFYACGYRAEFGGMCLWQPFNAAAPTFLISTALDFNPDIAIRESDGLMAIGSGQNQGETAQNLYIVDIAQGRFTKNGGAWQPLKIATVPPVVYDPIVAIGRPCWFGWYCFGQATLAPHTCNLLVPQSPKAYVTDLKGLPIYRYVQASPDSDVDALERAIAAAKADGETLPVLCYWTAQAQAIRVPKGADVYGVEAYQHKGESNADFEARVRKAVAMVSA